MVGEANSKEAASRGKAVQDLKSALKHPRVRQNSDYKD
jgi:hypothetical protein